MRQSKCLYVANAVFISPQGKVAPCGAIQNRKQLEVFESVEQLQTDPVFKDTKLYNALGRILDSKWCSHCKELEDMGVKSMRQRAGSGNSHDGFLSIAFSNTCNLDCVMCSSEYSSKWYQTWKHNAEIKEYFGGDTDSDRQYKPHGLSYEQIDEVLKIVPRLKGLIIKGGEPLVDPKVLYFLERCVDINPDINVSMVSNLTILNMKLLAKFRKLNLQVSIDGIHKTYEWIRGTEFSSVDYNIDQFHAAGGRIQIQPTMSAYNMENMEQLYQYYRSKGIFVQKTPIIATNDYLKATHLGRERFVQAADSFSFPFSMKYNEPTEAEKESFRRYTKVMNKHRGFEWEQI